MSLWSKMLHLGDLDLTVPVACAILAGLAATRAWRAALVWGLLLMLGLGLVGASKIAYLAWGAGLPALGFKSLSGHATGVAAVFPFLLYLLTRSRAAACAGLLLGAAVAALLVILNEHSVAEALAGFLLGCAISITGICCVPVPLRERELAHRNAHDSTHQHARWRALLLSGVAFAAAAGLMEFAHIGYWMMRAARHLSGQHTLFPLSTD